MKKLVIIILLSLVLIVFSIFFLIKSNNEKLLNNYLEQNNYFLKSDIQLDKNISLNIVDNAPKVEAASAFYPFAANLFKNIYTGNLNFKNFVKLVSTSQAFNDVVNGAADIIIVTSPSNEQREMIESSNVNLNYIPIYLEPLAILVNKGKEVENLNIEQIQEVYYGSNLNWNTYQLEENNGSQTCFETIVENNKLEKNHYEIDNMPEIIDKVALDKNGIGYSFYSYYSIMHKNTDAKIINVDNKKISDVDYPLLFEVYLVYRTDYDNENIEKIANWLKTDEGIKVINLLTRKES